MTAGEATGGTMYYALGENASTAPADESLYTTSIPTATNAGTYYIWYKVVGDADHNDSAADSVEMRIDKAAPTVTAPMATNPVYTGSAQNLITAGTTTGGEMQYSTDGTAYSANIPQGTDVKTYTVYYKVVGDTNYKDVAAQTLTVL